MFPNPYIILAELVVTIALVIGAFLYGEHLANIACDDRVKQMQIDAAKAVEVEKANEATKANTASTTLETKAAAAQVIYRTITRNVDRIVTKPIYQNVCLDADGLSLANAALAGVSVMLPAPLPATPMMAAKP